MRLGVNPAHGWKASGHGSEHSCGWGNGEPAPESLSSLITSTTAGRRRLSFRSGLLLGAASLFGDAAKAQEAPTPAPLPPLNVETTAKKKAPAKKAKAKQAAPTQPTSPAPQPPPTEAATAEAAPLPGQAGPPAPGSFKADYSSSPKMTAPLLDTPQTVTVIPNAIIEERNATNLTETLRNTPGISFNAGENGFSASTNNFQIRGFDSSGNIFVDGVRDSGSYARDVFNIDRVEVVKGAAADNGRGGAGGYVNLVTKSPLHENFINSSATLSFDEYGTDPHFRSTIDMNERVGTVAVRMNGMIEDGGIMGRDVAELEAYGLAPSITFGMGTDTRVTFAYERLERQDLPEWGVPAHTINGMFRYDPVAAKAGRDNFYGLSSDFDDVRADSVVARIEHDLSPYFTISNQTRWSETDRQSRFTYPNGFTLNGTGDGGTVTTPTQFYDRVNTSVSNLTNLAGTFLAAGMRHTLSTGVEYTYEASDANRQSNGSSTTDIFNPEPDRALGLPFDPTQRNGVDINTVAAYLYDTIEITRHWEVTGGLRVEHYNVEIESKAADGTPLDQDGYENGETTLGGKIGLVYKPVPEGSLYASYGASALPPGSFLSNPDISRLNDGSAFPGFVPGADPVRMHNYETGIKWDFFNGRLSTTAALFRTEKKDVPHVTRDSSTIWLEEQVVQGIEIGIAGSITDRWKAFGGLLWLHSERKNSAAFNAEACVDRPGDFGVPAGNTDDETAQNCVGVTTNGDELAFTPSFTATLWTTYDVTREFTVGGGVQYVGESWLGRPDDALRIVKNGVFGKLPDYFLVNLMAAYDVTENVALQFNVDNVFDELAAVSANWPGQRALLAPPRTYRIGLDYKY
jgi:catecholate siderophore receptor